MKTVYKRCPCCVGKKEIMGAGCMKIKCRECDGMGLVEDKLIKEQTQVAADKFEIEIVAVKELNEPKQKRKYTKRIRVDLNGEDNK